MLAKRTHQVHFISDGKYLQSVQLLKCWKLWDDRDHHQTFFKLPTTIQTTHLLLLNLLWPIGALACVELKLCCFAVSLSYKYNGEHWITLLELWCLPAQHLHAILFYSTSSTKFWGTQTNQAYSQATTNILPFTWITTVRAAQIRFSTEVKKELSSCNLSPESVSQSRDRLLSCCFLHFPLFPKHKKHTIDWRVFT